MKREIIVRDGTFIINSFYSETSKETAEELLRRVIVKNAEIEAKKRPSPPAVEESSNSQPKCLD